MKSKASFYWLKFSGGFSSGSLAPKSGLSTLRPVPANAVRGERERERESARSVKRFQLIPHSPNESIKAKLDYYNNYINCTGKFSD